MVRNCLHSTYTFCVLLDGHDSSTTREKLLNMAGIQLHTERHVVGTVLECALLELAIWVNMVPQRSEGVGDPRGLRGVCSRNQRLEVGGRAETLGRHPLDPRPSMWLAGSLAVCRSQVPPFPPTMPPSASLDHTQRHDTRMLGTMESLLGSVPGTQPQKATAHMLATWSWPTLDFGQPSLHQSVQFGSRSSHTGALRSLLDPQWNKCPMKDLPVH